MKHLEQVSDPLRARTAYREQLSHWAHALATGHPEEVPALGGPDPALMAEMFVGSNQDKRAALLKKYLEFVAPQFDQHFDCLLDSYVQAVPLRAFAHATADADGFLEWLNQTCPLTAEQRDWVACQRARFAVGFRAQANRQQHLHYQELWSVAEQLMQELDFNSALRVHLNPTCVWARFETSALLDDQEAPADALFFTIAGGVRTVVLGEEGRGLVKELEDECPCTLEEWFWQSHEEVSVEDLREFCRSAAQPGLVAFS